MQIIATKQNKKQLQEITVSHLDEPDLVFDGRMGYFGGGGGDLFQSLNVYIALMPAEQQLKLYKLYRECLLIIDPVMFGVVNARNKQDVTESRNYDYLINAVEPLVRKIMELLRPKNYEMYNDREGLTQPPAGLSATIRRGEYTSDMTVNQEEYVQLARFALLIRPLLPIYLKMIAKMETITGKDYKEIVTGRLINTNPVFTHHPGWKKINDYVVSVYQSKTINMLNLTVSSEDANVKRAIYLITFYRLGATHVPSQDPSKDLAKQMFSVVRQFDAPSNTVREKEFKGKDESQDKRGLHEIYHVKEEVNSADIQRWAEYFTMSHYDNRDNPIHNNRYVYQCKGLGISDPLKVDKVFDLIPSSWDYRLSNHVLQILQLTFCEDISYELYMNLDFEQLMSALALAACKLHEEGYPHLAQVVMSNHDATAERTNTDRIFNLTEEERDALLSKCGLTKSGSNITTENELVSSVISTLSGLGNGVWSSVIDVDTLDNHLNLDESPSGEVYHVEMCRAIKDEYVALVLSRN